MNTLLEALKNLREENSVDEHIIAYASVIDHMSHEIYAMFDSFEEAKKDVVENDCYAVAKYLLSPGVTRNRFGRLDPQDDQILEDEIVWINPDYDSELEEFFSNHWDDIDEYIACKSYWNLCKMLKTEYPDIYKKALSKNMIIDNIK